MDTSSLALNARRSSDVRLRPGCDWIWLRLGAFDARFAPVIRRRTLWALAAVAFIFGTNVRLSGGGGELFASETASAQRRVCECDSCSPSQRDGNGCCPSSLCAVHCSRGHVRAGNRCVCPEGNDEVGGQCMLSCPIGATRDANHACQCPIGQETFRGTCVAACTGGEQRTSAGLCECASTQQRIGGRCVGDCPAGFELSPTGSCVTDQRRRDAPRASPCRGREPRAISRASA